MRKYLFLVLCALSTTAVLGCSDDKDDADCDPKTYKPICTTQMMQQYCDADGKFVTSKCDNGCDNATGQCTVVGENNCAAGKFTWTCSEDHKQSNGCSMNKPYTENCVNGCSDATGRCICDASKCAYGCKDDGSCKDAPACDTTKCPDGCNADGSCVEDICAYRCDKERFIGCLHATDQAERILTCSSHETCSVEAQGCVSKQAYECTDGDTKCASYDDDATLLIEDEELLMICENGHWVRTIRSLCEITQSCDADSGLCVEDDYTCKPGCFNSVTLITCNEDGEEVKTTCGNRCDPNKNACADDTCDPATFKTTCQTVTSQMVCDTNGKLKGVDCPDDKPMCVLGECRAASAQQTTCTTGVTCSDDGRSIITCKDNEITTKECDADRACKESSDASVEPTCEKAVWESEGIKYCDPELFASFCDKDGRPNNCVEVSQGDYEIDDTACKTNEKCTMVGGEAKCSNEWYLNANIGDKCTDARKGTYFCKDDVPMWCNDKGYIHAVEDDTRTCASQGMFCAVYKDEGKDYAGCFEPCNKAGKITTCIRYDAETAATIDASCELVDGKLALVLENYSNLNYCDFGCAEGKCIDYTADIENVGEACDPNEFKAYCTENGPLRAVSCDPVDVVVGEEASETDPTYTINVELCYADEICRKDGYKASCQQTCTEGEIKYSCEYFLNNYISYPSTCTRLEDGTLGYVEDKLDFDVCDNGCDDTNTKCKAKK